MNVLSLFDGMSCGRLALDRAGIKADKYYASEIDKYAQIVSNANYPDILRLGDVTKWLNWYINYFEIDLIIAGSPCQGFSFAGKQLAFNDPRSKLFFEFTNILEHVKLFNPGVKFLLENVRMKKQHMDVITNCLEVEPVCINSALVSAQNRVRYYWANWEFEQPKDRGILLNDILENNAIADRDKAHCLDANYSKGASWGQYKKKSRRQLVVENGNVRKLTPLECELAQNLPVDYTNHVSKSQRYKMIGNGMTIDVMAHILSYLKQ